MKYNFLKKIFQFAAIVLIITGCNSNNSKRPNVLFIAVDDLRPELGCYGNNEIKTPNLDKFAENGFIFKNAYCQAAVCAPSRASVMTGLRPDSNHVWHLGDKFRKNMPDVVTIPQYFHKYGYYTVSMGKIFHNYMPDSVSFDEPDLRPPKYNTKDMIDRDAETFYYDEGIKRKQKARRDSIVAKRPNAYANGWACGPSHEIADVPDSMFYDGAQTELAIKTLKRLKKRNQPFFLALGYYRPHLPFVAPKKYWDMYDRDSISPAPNPFLPKNSPVMAMNSMYELKSYYDFRYIKHPIEFTLDEKSARMLKHGYYASVSYADALIGKVLASLKKLGLENNTIVVIWGDHGWKLGEHNSWCKQTNYDIDTRVPLLVRLPGAKNSGAEIKALTELVDLYPSLLDMAGIEVPEYLQGTSFVPLLENPEREWKDAVFSQFHRRPKITPDRKRYMGYSMQTDRYHYVEWRYWDNKSKTAGDIAAVELYDHLNDPDENFNIAEENEKLVETLSKRLKEGWRKAVPKAH